MTEEPNYVIQIIDNIMNDDNVGELAKGTLENFVSTVISEKGVSMLKKGKKVFDFISDIPSHFFFAKFKYYLMCIYNNQDDKFNYNEKINMASVFSEDNKCYQHFVQHTICMIDSLETNDKIKYYATLSRYLVMGLIDYPIFLYLAQIIKNSTSFELNFIKEKQVDYKSENNFIISSLIIRGLMQLNSERTGIYEFTNIAIKLKQYCLSDDIPISEKVTYNNVEPISQLEPMSDSDGEKIIESWFN